MKRAMVGRRAVKSDATHNSVKSSEDVQPASCRNIRHNPGMSMLAKTIRGRS